MVLTVVADPSETMRLGLRALLERQDGQFVVSEASTRVELMQKIERNICQLVVLEPLLYGGSGESVIRQIGRISPKANILVYTDLDELKFGIRAIRAGAKGFLMKNCSSRELLAAASRVGAGKVYLSDTLAEEVARNAWENKPEQPHASLSEREMLVFSMLVCGRTVTAIAGALHLSVKTISTHKAHAMSKLGCRNLSDLVHYAIERKLKDECEVRTKIWESGRAPRSVLASLEPA